MFYLGRFIVEMGSSPSHPGYDVPASPPLQPAVFEYLRGKGALFDVAAKFAPLALMRAAYNRDGLISFGALLREDVASREMTMGAADSVSELRCRLYTPGRAAAATYGPLVFYMHGGGWTVGSVSSHDNACRFLAAETGFRVFAADYRLAPEVRYPGAQDDVFSLYRQVCSRPADFGLDPARPQIILCGDSAGGQLAIGLALTIRNSNRGDPSVRAPDVAAAPGPLPQPVMLLPLYPVINRFRQWTSTHKYSHGYRLSTTLLDYMWACYVGETPEARARHASDAILCPDLQPDLSGLPPTVLVTAECDILHDEGAAFVETMNARGAGGTAVHVDVPGMIHGFVVNLHLFPSAAEAMRDVCGRMVAVCAAADAAGALAAARRTSASTATAAPAAPVGGAGAAAP